MNTFKISRQIDENHFEIEVGWDRIKYCSELGFQIIHDYVGILQNNFIPTKDMSVKIEGQNASNGISLASYVQVPIRDFVSFCLPLVKKSEYCTEKHIKNNYTSGNSVIYYYDKGQKCHMVAIRLRDEEVYTCITRTFFNKFVRPTLENELFYNT